MRALVAQGDAKLELHHYGVCMALGDHTPFVNAWLLKEVSQEPRSARREITASYSLC